MIQSMEDLERTWNSKFNYPWTFFNDVPFTAEFKRRTQAATKAKCFYGEKLLHLVQISLKVTRDDTERALGSPVMDQQATV